MSTNLLAWRPRRDERRTCFLVLGMHRSGTSALARVLSLAGAELPSRLMEPGEGNETGHWEPFDLVVYLEQIMFEIGASWHDPAEIDLSQLPPERMSAIRRDIAAAIASNYPGPGPIVMKDPRMCRFMPIVGEALASLDMRVVPVLIFRNPAEVAHSLERRRKFWPARYSRRDAESLWLRHVLESEIETRSYERAFISYDSLLRNWRKALRSIRSQTGVELPRPDAEARREIDAFLDPQLRHHFSADDDGHVGDAIGMLCGRAFAALGVLEISPTFNMALAELDLIREESRALLPSFRPMMIKTDTSRDVMPKHSESVVSVMEETRQEAVYAMSDPDIDVARHEFDSAFYLDTYPDIGAAKVDPLQHFCGTGWREGRNPCAWFNTSFYLSRYEDVAAAKINPFVHYLRVGRSERRNPKPLPDLFRDTLEAAHFEEAKPGDYPVQPSMNDEEAARAFLALEDGPIIVAVSHVDYRVSTGGVQNVISDEVRRARVERANYLHLSPTFSDLRLAPEGHVFFQVRLNGLAIGVLTLDQIADAISRHSALGWRAVLVVHHLAGHAPETIAELATAAGISRSFVWAHDYFLTCPSFALLRNDVEFCGGPDIKSGACRICVYGRARARHVARMAAFLDRLKPTLLAPSAEPLEMVQQVTGHSSEADQVLPLALLIPIGIATRGGAKSRYRIAHLGARNYFKGWATFQALAERFMKDERYEFLQLGLDAPGQCPDFIRNVEVLADSSSRHAMIHALEREDVDVVLSWSLCHETFGFTAHEAIAAGCVVVGREGSGNIPGALQMHAAQSSILLSDEAQLHALFADGDALLQRTSAPRRRAVLVSGAGTFALSGFREAIDG